MIPRPHRIAATVVVSLLPSCGRTGLLAPPVELECRQDPALPGAGCRFVAVPPLHLVGAIESLSDKPDRREPDGVLVVNPDPDADVEVFAAPVPIGEDAAILAGYPITVPAGEMRVLALPTPDRPDGTTRRQGGLVHVHASAPVTATTYAPLRPFEGNDSLALLPDDALGDTYVVASYPPHPAQFQGAGQPSYFEVVALRDDTVVRWRPPKPTAGDGERIARVEGGQWSDDVTLGRYETLRVAGADPSQSTPSAGDVSGTVIEASTPVVAVSGSRCASVPPSVDAVAGCDPLIEQLVPVSWWGPRVSVAHPPLRGDESHYVRIYAGADGITLRTEPSVLDAASQRLARQGDFIDLTVPHGTSFVALADGPILALLALATRDRSVELGDPALVQLLPAERYLSRYRVGVPMDWSTNFAQVTRPASGPPIHLDGVALDGWESFADQQTTVVPLDPGTHVVSSDAPFGLTQYGWTNTVYEACVPFGHGGFCHTAYAHPAGARMR